MVTENLGFLNEINGVDAFYTTYYPLGKAAKFIGNREVPSGLNFA